MFVIGCIAKLVAPVPRLVKCMPLGVSEQGEKSYLSLGGVFSGPRFGWR